MKRFLLLILCSILAFPNTSSAADVGSMIESLLQRFGADKVYSKHCVSSCQALGYTVSMDKLDGRTDCIACPFELDCNPDKTDSKGKWYNCPSYSCADLGLFSKKPEGVNCTTITSAQKPGLTETCYSCQCAPGTLNTAGCENKLAVLNDSPAKCVALGYRNSVTECENYLACPSDPNRVHCLADTCAAGQSGCSQLIELPENATGITTKATCCDGTTKDVISDFTCNTGYTLSADKKSCEATVCERGQYAGPEDAAEGATYKLEDCMASADWLIGWKKVKVNANSTCYTCKCLLDEISGGNPSDEALALLKQYPYTRTYDDEGLAEVACDNRHYKQCSCPINQEPKTIAGKALFEVVETEPGLWEWKKPSANDIIAEPIFSACCKSDTGDKHNFVSGFTCNAANGWVISPDRTTCDATYCEGKKDNVYYSKQYTTPEACNQAFGSTGWTYTPGKSGGEICGQCKCTATTGKYAQTDSEDQSLVEYGEPVCDGIHFNVCKLKAEFKDDYILKDVFLKDNPNVSASSIATVKLCTEEYVRKTGIACNPGFEADSKGICQEIQCDKDIYKLSEEDKIDLTKKAAEQGHPINFDECQSGSSKVYQLTSCGNENTNYAIDSDKTGCCQICDTDAGYTVNLCGEKQKADETVISKCDGKTTCYHCIDE